MAWQSSAVATSMRTAALRSPDARTGLAGASTTSSAGGNGDGDTALAVGSGVAAGGSSGVIGLAWRRDPTVRQAAPLGPKIQVEFGAEQEALHRTKGRLTESTLDVFLTAKNRAERSVFF